MADAKITALGANTTPLGTDITVIVDDPGGSPVTQKITLADLMKVNVTNPILMGSGTQKGVVSESAAAERGTHTPCRVNSAGSKYVSMFVQFPIPFVDGTGLTVTLTSETVFAPSSNTDRAAGATKATTLVYNADGNCVGFSRSYLDNTNFVGNSAYLVAFNWSATRT